MFIHALASPCNPLAVHAADGSVHLQVVTVCGFFKHSGFDLRIRVDGVSQLLYHCWL